jgi:pyruvate dehydrogenase E2 component (dihydrolipoamide acetyltransferase)
MPSLEDNVAALVDAITANTDAIQHLAATWRGAPPTTVLPAAPPVPKPRGRQAAPPSPIEAAAAPAPAPTPAPAPAAVPVASATSASPTDGTYADLQTLVPQVAEKLGRAKAVELFAKVGATSGLAIKDDPVKVAEAVRLFRSALE